MLHPSSFREFESILRDAEQNNRVVVVDFFTSWCGPCKRIAPDYVRLSERNPHITFVKFQCDGDDEREEYSQDIGINCFPTFRFYWDGKECEDYRVKGSDLNKVEQYALHLHAELSPMDASDAGVDPETWGTDRASLRENTKFVERVRATGYRRLVYAPDPSWIDFLEDVRM